MDKLVQMNKVWILWKLRNAENSLSTNNKNKHVKFHLIKLTNLQLLISLQNTVKTTSHFNDSQHQQAADISIVCWSKLYKVWITL